MCEQYNGYKNRETWAAALWLNNDQNLGDSFRDWLEVRCEDRYNDETQADWWNHDYNSPRYAETWADTHLTLSGFLYTYADEWPNNLQAVASDIGSLYRVDWREVMDAVLPE